MVFTVFTALFTAIIFFVANHLLIVGQVNAFLFVIMWGVLPIGMLPFIIKPRRPYFSEKEPVAALLSQLCWF